MSLVTWKEKGFSSDQWRIMMLAASYGATTPSVAHAIAAASMMESPIFATAKQSPAKSGSRVLGFLRDLWAQYRTYRKLNETVGKEIEIPFYRSNDILIEAKRHQWLEAEKAGRDIWRERDPYDPEGCALRDWVSKYLDAWKRSNVLT